MWQSAGLYLLGIAGRVVPLGTLVVLMMKNPVNSTDFPKVDLHMHAETTARLDRLVSRRDNVPAHDWAEEVRALADVLPGMARHKQGVAALPTALDNDRLISLNDEDAIFVQWLTDALFETAADGAVLVEVRFGARGGLRSGIMSFFREAEGRVREIYPAFHAEAIVTGLWPGRDGASEAFASAIQAAEEGLAGIDFIPVPYDQEADWNEAYMWASRAVDAGLGITAHAGEFGMANIEAALKLPGVTRMGHGLHAASSTRLTDKVLQSGVTLECCLTSNVVLGAVSSLRDHPIRKLMDAGIPVTLASDDPIRMCTSIGREYKLAMSLGFGSDQLMEMTVNGIRASFARPSRRESLLLSQAPSVAAFIKVRFPPEVR